MKQVTGLEASLVIPAHELASGTYLLWVRGADCPQGGVRMVVIVQ